MQQPEPDAEELAARLRAHLAELLQHLGEPLTDESGEVRELTAADFRTMCPAAEVLPPELVAVLEAEWTDAHEAELRRRVAEDPDDWMPSEADMAQAKPFAEAFPDLAQSLKRPRARRQAMRAQRRNKRPAVSP